MENRFLTSYKAKGTAYEFGHNQRELVFVLPGKVSRVAQIYAHEHHVTIIEAIRRFYHSDTYKRLADETTKLWHYGPVALYQEFTDELKQKGNEYGDK